MSALDSAPDLINLPRTIHTRSELFAHYKELTAPVRKSSLQLVPFWVLPALDGKVGIPSNRNEEEL